MKTGKRATRETDGGDKQHGRTTAMSEPVTVERVERALAILAVLERLDGPLMYVALHTTLLLELVALRAERSCRPGDRRRLAEAARRSMMAIGCGPAAGGFHH
jgi:hypothetical protein